MNDKPVRDGEELVNKVADLPIGSPALLTIDRDGKKLDFKVTIEERSKVWENEPQVVENRPIAPSETSKPQVAPTRFGITIMRLTPKERKDLEIEAKDGVKVTSVDPGSFADDIGMVEGDAILSINRQPVMSPDDVMKLQSSLKPGQPVAVHVARNSNGGRRGTPQRYYLSGRLPEP
jgi:serine protease Do